MGKSADGIEQRSSNAEEIDEVEEAGDVVRSGVPMRVWSIESAWPTHE